MSSLIKKTVDFGEKNSDPRKKEDKITKITIHHMAGDFDPEKCALNHLKHTKISANYYIGSDGTIVKGVSEDRRSWCSANKDNDYAAITIEVANNSGEPNWTVSQEAYNSMIDLCVDICIRHNIKLTWTGESDGTLTTHDMFKATKCPGPYLKSKMRNIAMEVNRKVEEVRQRQNYMGF